MMTCFSNKNKKKKLKTSFKKMVYQMKFRAQMWQTSYRNMFLRFGKKIKKKINKIARKYSFTINRISTTLININNAHKPKHIDNLYVCVCVRAC